MNTRNTKPAREILEKIIGPFSFATCASGWRTTLNLTQAEMAKKLGMARGTLCDIEKGRQLVSISFAKEFAKKTGCSEKVAISAAIQDQLRKAKVKFRFELVG